MKRVRRSRSASTCIASWVTVAALQVWLLRALVAAATPYARWTGATMHPVLPPG